MLFLYSPFEREKQSENKMYRNSSSYFMWDKFIYMDVAREKRRRRTFFYSLIDSFYILLDLWIWVVAEAHTISGEYDVCVFILFFAHNASNTRFYICLVG